jgi:hypothetical protein
MPYLGTLGFHFLQALLGFLSVLYLFSKKESFYISPLKKYFTWFVFFALYNIALMISAIFYDAVPIMSGIGYLIALVFLAIGAWQAFSVAIELLPLAKGVHQILVLFYILGALVSVGLHAVFFEVPQALNVNWLLWYPNQIIAMPYILFMFLAGWAFAFALGKSILAVQETSLRTRGLFMSMSGFILPFAALFYFAAGELSHIYISFGTVTTGMVLFVFANIGVAITRRSR